MIKRRHGFAGATAVTMLALVGVTIAAMSSMFVAEARRTRDAAIDAQMRQLLIAGAAVAGQQLQSPEPANTEIRIELPPAPAAEGFGLVLRPAAAADPGVRVIEVIASWNEREMNQTLRFVRRQDRWALAGARLNP
jgi:hypothetical protein